MNTILRNLILEGKHNKPILTDVFYQANKIQKPVVIFCHGYKGFKDWGAWDLVANTFADAGFFFVKFNFSHNGGTVEQPIDFPDLEAFGNNNYIKELDDLETVINWITDPDFEHKDLADTSKIILIGHSRGGGIVTIKASEDSRISKVISWAGVSDYKSRFPQGEALSLWKEEEVYYVLNGRTKQQMPHYFQFYASFLEQEKRLTISEAAKQINIPHLIVHGTADPTVNVQEAEKLHQWNPKSELYLVSDADHVFNAKHPWNEEKMPKNLQSITEKSIDFARI